MVVRRKKSKQKEAAPQTSRHSKLLKNLLRMTEQFMGGKSFLPLSEEELMERLSLPAQHAEVFREVLKLLVDTGKIEKHKGKFSWKELSSDVATGTLRLHPRGFGFLQSDTPLLHPQDIFIPKHLTKNAVDGDKVEVLINQEVVSEKGPEGRVLAILSRSRSHVAGTIKQVAPNGEMVAHVPILGSQQLVIVESTGEQLLRVGDRIVMEVVDWGTKETGTFCKFSHHLGHISDPSCDISAAIEEFELRVDFPTRAAEEAAAFGKKVSQAEIGQREDLRDSILVTIDPDTAKDFDDAISLTLDTKGIYHLGVHIADVSHYVKPGTALDQEAALRCNSTYFPGTCIPMLPGALSENLCSLKPEVNRLAVSVFMQFNSQGDLLDYRISRSVIRSAKRFTYREAKLVLDGKKRSPYADLLALMVDLCRLLKQKRYQRGSIEFSIPELVILVDEKGDPHGTDYVTYDVTHQMVEEFMLKANELVALHLSQKGKNLTYRIHEEPAEENLRDFAFLAAAFGFKIQDKPTPQQIQKLFEEAAETPFSAYLASNYIRRMRLAAYSPDNIGHYGLSLTHYCHFTSPIRRYVDLVVHRILFGESDDFEALQKIAAQCSEQERISAKAENSVRLLKKLRLLRKMHIEDSTREYRAIITKVKPFGIYFEMIELLLEGFIHISELGDEYFVFEEQNMRLRGSETDTLCGVGNEIGVMVQNINEVSQEVNWYLVSPPHSPLMPKRSQKRTKGRRSR